MNARPPSSVLIVDDEALVARGYARLLRRRGYEVATASSAAEAIGMMEDKTFDVVVSDLMMPGDDGIAMLRAVRTVDADLPVILMTGCPTLESAVEAVDSGATKYLMKPVVVGLLEKAVEQAIDGFQLARHRRDALAHCVDSVKATDERDALSHGFDRAVSGLWMAYQPIVSWSRREIFAFEALVRTDEPTFPNPGVFLGAAEQLHKLGTLGRAVRASVASRLASSDAEALAFVNLHPEDLADPNLFSELAPLTAFASQVVLEITERSSLELIADLGERVAKLKAMGFRIAIDDLGSGYSGLSSVLHLNPDVVKLDMSLVRGIGDDRAKRILVSSMINLCRELNILVVAEGIETVDERDALIAVGCDLLQGYLFARPQREFPAIAWHDAVGCLPECA